MKLLLINGSPNPLGNTDKALAHFARQLDLVGIAYTHFHVGATAIGCLGCGGCKENQRCAVEDRVNKAIEIAKGCDGYVLASPVHYGSASGAMTGFLDRFFRAGKPYHMGKCGATIAVARRAGGMTTLEQLGRYFPLFSMTNIGGDYWNILYSGESGDVMADREGLLHLGALATSFASYEAKRYPTT